MMHHARFFASVVMDLLIRNPVSITNRISSGLRDLRRELVVLRPKKCCNPVPMTAGGITTMLCSEDCQWQKLDLLLCNATVDMELLRTQVERLFHKVD